MTIQRLRGPMALGAAIALCALSSTTGALAKKGNGNSDKIVFFLISTGADTDATAKVKFEDKNSKETLRLDLRDLPVGSYDLVVGGVIQATIPVVADNSGSGETKGELRYDSKKGNPVPFDPFGQTFAITQTGTATSFFSDTFPATMGPIPEVDFELDLVSAGAVLGAEGNARYRVRNGRTDFDVEIEDVPAGDYELRANGVVVGTITAAQRPGKNSIEGEIEFSTDLNEVGHEPLTFNPLGAMIEVFQNGTLILSIAFPVAPPV